MLLRGQEVELMTRLWALEGVIKELKGQFAAETAPRNRRPQIHEHQNVHQPQ